MTPTLIVLLLGGLAVAVVAWIVHRKSARPYPERLDQDTAWNDPVTPAEPRPPEGEPRP